jgi:glyceraldehyde 3-phosphate dehydrogenase
MFRPPSFSGSFTLTTKIGINGFGRIGRCVTRALLAQNATDIELVGINDLTDAKTLAHLLKYDSVHRTLDVSVTAEDKAIVVGGKRIPILAERDPGKLPWKDLGAEIVLECTGIFTAKEKAIAHVNAGAKRVIISAPGGNDVDATFCFGINHASYDPAKHVVFSNASCTTNCLAPIAKVLDDKLGIVKGNMLTVHSYTNDQNILDLPHKDLRRARAAALSMIPSSTGAAKAIGLVLPSLKGKLDGTSIRVPTPNVSIVCLSVVVGKKTSKDEVNALFKAAAEGELKGVLKLETDQLVSSDFIGNPHSSIVDAALTQVIDGDFVEVQAWYDNEWGFSNRMVDLTRYIAQNS